MGFVILESMIPLNVTEMDEIVVLFLYYLHFLFRSSNYRFYVFIATRRIPVALFKVALIN